jgi:hypothetical protein
MKIEPVANPNQPPTPPVRNELKSIPSRIRHVETRRVLALELDVDPGSPLWLEIEAHAQAKKTMLYIHEDVSYQMIVRQMGIAPVATREDVRAAQVDPAECVEGIIGRVHFEGRELLEGE